jgi:cytochrome c oxidase subunit 3
MEVPYTVKNRPDTGLYNAKIGIWLFLASEVMLFGALFSSYILLRVTAQEGEWPTELLNVPIGTVNTLVLILSSVTVVMAWASLKLNNFKKFKF